MIPKTIHYCWFGGQPIPPKLRKRIKKWERALGPDYNIMRWNETNYDLSKCPPYVQQAYQSKKWAFVSDYVRISVLLSYGGIYLDTDVDLRNNFDAYLELPAFISHESEESFCTAVIGSMPNNPLLKSFLSSYDSESFVFDKSTLPNSVRLKQFMSAIYPNEPFAFGSQISLKDISIFPRTIFGAKDIHSYRLDVTAGTIAIHRLEATWYSPSHKFLKFCKRIVRGFINLFHK